MSLSLSKQIRQIVAGRKWNDGYVSDVLRQVPRIVDLKQWRYEEAIRAGVTDTAIAHRLANGRYPQIKLLRINSRVVFVLNPEIQK